MRTTTMTEALAAKRAITELIALYVHVIDRRDEDLLASLFTDDATLACGALDGPARELVAQRTDLLIRVEDEATTAQPYLTVVHRAEEDGVDNDEHLRARHLDRLRCVGRRWLSAQRTLVFDWSLRVRADAAPWWAGRSVRLGARGVVDPSAAVLGDLSSSLS